MSFSKDQFYIGLDGNIYVVDQPPLGTMKWQQKRRTDSVSLVRGR